MKFTINGNKTEYTTVRDSYDEHIQNHHCLHINRLDARPVIIPALSKGVYYRNKEESPFLQSLNGNWDFLWCREDMMPDFYKTDYDTSSWDTIDVPSMWQYRGYGKCTYPNIEYPIPFNPPYVCCENPVGYYKRSFNVEAPSARTVLHFGGVDNAFYVYVNGKLAGFSKGSRIPAEFDVTSLIKHGENMIAVKVYTYSDATYLENQDMLMANGIFRDVYLLHTGANSLWDYRVTTTMNSISVAAEFECADPTGFKVRLSLDGESVVYNLSKNISHTFTLKNPRLWNAEQPNLYDLTIELLNGNEVAEVVSKRVGIMHTEVKGNKFLVNGKPIYIKGVNRHEHDCRNGRAISVELIEKELRMIKDNNLNAVRCSHYTNHPHFYEFASEIGIYVMDEADIETHGAWVAGDQGLLSKNPDWYDAYFDRVKRMLDVNKNEACIFIWSLGNECGRGENINRCFEYVRNFDSTKEVISTQEDSYSPAYSRFNRIGYRNLEVIRTFESTGMPLMLIEYAHAMGNSPGFLEGYWDYIYTHENNCGGFVWEFKSHGFYAEDENGEEYYLYGGDFDDADKYNWANFCLDGYLTANGTPKPTWRELGEVSAPVYVSYDGRVRIMNTNDFRTLGYLTVKWELCEDFEVLKSGCFDMPDVAPHYYADFDITDFAEVPASKIPGAKYFLNMYFYDSAKRIASRQICISSKTAGVLYEKQDFECCVEASGNALTVRGSNFEITVADGALQKYVSGGKILIDKPMKMNFYRAGNDNDGVTIITDWVDNGFGRRKHEWAQRFVKTMRFCHEGTKAVKGNNEVVITSVGKVIADYEWYEFETEIEYRIQSDGKVLTGIHCIPFGNTPEVMPRMGVCFELPGNYRNAAWYGRGEDHSYPDSKFATPIGYYESSVDKMNFMYDVPQDTGNHENTSFVSISDGNSTGITVTGCNEFSFSYHDFALDRLDGAKHRNELKKSDSNYLYIDYKMRGLGSHSCGPEPEPGFELYPHEFRLAFVISDLQSKEEALASARTDFGIVTEALSERYVYIKTETENEVADCKGDE